MSVKPVNGVTTPQVQVATKPEQEKKVGPSKFDNKMEPAEPAPEPEVGSSPPPDPQAAAVKMAQQAGGINPAALRAFQNMMADGANKAVQGEEPIEQTEPEPAVEKEAPVAPTASFPEAPAAPTGPPFPPKGPEKRKTETMREFPAATPRVNPDSLLDPPANTAAAVSSIGGLNPPTAAWDPDEPISEGTVTLVFHQRQWQVNLKGESLPGTPQEGKLSLFGESADADFGDAEFSTGNTLLSEGSWEQKDGIISVVFPKNYKGNVFFQPPTVTQSGDELETSFPPEPLTPTPKSDEDPLSADGLLEVDSSDVLDAVEIPSEEPVPDDTTTASPHPPLTSETLAEDLEGNELLLPLEDEHLEEETPQNDSDAEIDAALDQVLTEHTPEQTQETTAPSVEVPEAVAQHPLPTGELSDPMPQAIVPTPDTDQSMILTEPPTPGPEPDEMDTVVQQPAPPPPTPAQPDPADTISENDAVPASQSDELIFAPAEHPGKTGYWHPHELGLQNNPPSGMLGPNQVGPPAPPRQTSLEHTLAGIEPPQAASAARQQNPQQQQQETSPHHTMNTPPATQAPIAPPAALPVPPPPAPYRVSFAPSPPTPDPALQQENLALRQALQSLLTQVEQGTDIEITGTVKKPGVGSIIGVMLALACCVGVGLFGALKLWNKVPSVEHWDIAFLAGTFILGAVYSVFWTFKWNRQGETKPQTVHVQFPIDLSAVQQLLSHGAVQVPKPVTPPPAQQHVAVASPVPTKPPAAPQTPAPATVEATEPEEETQNHLQTHVGTFPVKESWLARSLGWTGYWLDFLGDSITGLIGRHKLAATNFILALFCMFSVILLWNHVKIQGIALVGFGIATFFCIVFAEAGWVHKDSISHKATFFLLSALCGIFVVMGLANFGEMLIGLWEEYIPYAVILFLTFGSWRLIVKMANKNRTTTKRSA